MDVVKKRRGIDREEEEEETDNMDQNCYRRNECVESEVEEDIE